MTCAPSHTIPDKALRGRPREHDREQIAIDIIEWAKKEDSINLCKFCALYNPIIPPNKLTLWAKEDDSFRQAYESAKLFLGFRREEWLNQEHLHVKAYDLNATTYDFFLKEEKQSQSKFEAQLASEVDKKEDKELVDKFTMLCQAFQKAQSDRNIDDKSNSKE